jgi:hypothetical protein
MDQVGQPGSGSSRSACEAGLAPLRHVVHILPDLMRALHQRGADPQEAFRPLDGRLTLLLDDLVWWSEASPSPGAGVPEPGKAPLSTSGDVWKRTAQRVARRLSAARLLPRSVTT